MAPLRSGRPTGAKLSNGRQGTSAGCGLAARDTTLVDNTPIDYLDFASPVAGLGSKMGLDATNKWPGETNREWGTPIVMDAAVKKRVDEMWGELGL